MAVPKMLPNPALAKFLRERRASFNMTQEQMVQALHTAGYPDVSVQTLSRWEAHGAVPALRQKRYLTIFAVVYKTTPGHLFGLTGQLDSVPMGEWGTVVRKIQASPELISLLHNATEKQIILAGRILRTILEFDE